MRVVPLWSHTTTPSTSLSSSFTTSYQSPPNLRRSLDHVRGRHVPTRRLPDWLRQPTSLGIPACLELSEHPTKALHDSATPSRKPLHLCGAEPAPPAKPKVARLRQRVRARKLGVCGSLPFRGSRWNTTSFPTQSADVSQFATQSAPTSRQHEVVILLYQALVVLYALRLHRTLSYSESLQKTKVMSVIITAVTIIIVTFIMDLHVPHLAVWQHSYQYQRRWNQFHES